VRRGLGKRARDEVGMGRRVERGSKKGNGNEGRTGRKEKKIEGPCIDHARPKATHRNNRDTTTELEFSRPEYQIRRRLRRIDQGCYEFGQTCREKTMVVGVIV